MSDVHVRVLGADDEPAMWAYLRPHADRAMFLLGNARAAGLVDRGQVWGGTYVAAFNDQRIVGVACQSWNGVLLFHAPDHVEQLAAAAIGRTGRPVRGVNCVADQAERVIDLLGLPTDGANVQISNRHGLYALDIAAMKRPAGDLQVRPMTEADVDQCWRLQAAYLVEEVNARADADLANHARATLIDRVGRMSAWLAERDGRVVSITGFNARTDDRVQVGGVYTPSEWRGRGYARQAIAGSLRDAAAEGAERAVLFAADDNDKAIRCYRSLGFERIDDYRLLFLHDPVRVAVA